MPKVACLYLDDSGTRHPDHKTTLPAHGHDWFALGGVLIPEEDEDGIRAAYDAFCAKWEIAYPLHSVEIRGRSENFTWLGQVSSCKRQNFFDDLEALLFNAGLLGIACVIDRKGYNHRYLDLYGRQRWALCKSAFSIVVERAAKHAAAQDRKLRVFFEESDRKSDDKIRQYYMAMKTNGMPFSTNMDKYSPLQGASLKSILYDLKGKRKSSPMCQLADLYLWPMAIGGYDPTNFPYRRLMERQRIIDATLPPDAIPSRGVKYFCWDLELERQKANGPVETGPRQPPTVTS